MNSDFDKLVSEIATSSSPWERFDPMHAAAAYHYAKEKYPVPKIQDDDVTIPGLILAGVHSVYLAHCFIDTKDQDPILHECSLRVLKAWGIEYKPPAVPPSAATPEPVLHWPPKPPAQLPEVYTTHYYHVREVLEAPRANDAVVLNHDTRLVAPGDKLIFTGTVNWNTDRDCWAMRMSMATEPGAGAFWIHSRDLRVGDEIPKGQ